MERERRREDVGLAVGWIVVPSVDDGAGAATALERVVQRSLVYGWSATNVHNDCRRAHRLESLVVDDTSRLGCQWHRDHEEVCCAPEVAQAVQRKRPIDERGCAYRAAIGDMHFHFEGLGARRDCLADVTEAE